MKTNLLLRIIIPVGLILLLNNCGLWEFDEIEFFEVTTGEPENITKSTAEISATFSNLRNASLQELGFCWSSTHNSPTLAENEGLLSIRPGPEPVFRMLLPDLAVRTVYYVTAYATIEGRTSYGDVQTFVTKGIQILTDENVEMNLDTAFVSGSLVGVDQEIFIIDHGHYYSTQQGFESENAEKFSLSEKKADGVFTSKLTGLKNNTTYYARSFLTTNEGATLYGGEISFQVSIPLEKKADFPGLPRSKAVSYVTGEEAFFGLGNNSIDESVLDDFWKYDRFSDTWDALKKYGGGKRYNAAAFSIDGEGYVGTGVDQNGNLKADFWRYRKGSNDWTQVADYPAPVTAAVGVTVDNTGYVILGALSSSTFKHYIDIILYDKPGNTWEWILDLPEYTVTPAIKYYVFPTDKKVYFRSDGNRTLWEIDTTTGEVKEKTSFQYDIHLDAIYFTIGSKIYFGGGVTYINGENLNLSEFWEFNLQTEEWKRLPDLEFPAGGISTHSFSIGDHGYVVLFSGANNFWEFTPPQ